MTHGMIAPTEVVSIDERLHAEVMAEFEQYVGMSYELAKADAIQNGLTIFDPEDEQTSA